MHKQAVGLSGGGVHPRQKGRVIKHVDQSPVRPREQGAGEERADDDLFECFRQGGQKLDWVGAWGFGCGRGFIQRWWAEGEGRRYSEQLVGIDCVVGCRN